MKTKKFVQKKTEKKVKYFHKTCYYEQQKLFLEPNQRVDIVRVRFDRSIIESIINIENYHPSEGLLNVQDAEYI